MADYQVTLKELILSETKRRDISLRGFAELLGVASATVLRYTNDPDAKPSVEFLVKLAHVTGYDFISLLTMCWPEVQQVINETRPSPEAVIFAQRFQQYPQEQREVLRGIIFK